MNWTSHENCWIPHPYSVAEDENFRYECCFRNGWFATVQCKKLRAVYTTRYDNISLSNKKKAIAWCENFNPLEFNFKGKDANKIKEMFAS